MHLSGMHVRVVGFKKAHIGTFIGKLFIHTPDAHMIINRKEDHTPPQLSTQKALTCYHI